MQVRQLEMDGVLEILPGKFDDDRGFFSETYNAQALSKCGVNLEFVQDNHSYSSARGVLRGLHFQAPPFAQDKLVRVVRGRIYDVVVDIRQGSPTFGKWLALEVSAQGWNQILVPKGFAHGFLTLERDCEVVYKVTAPYNAECDCSVRFDDPDIGIDWPIERSLVSQSEKDKTAARLAEINTGFVY